MSACPRLNLVQSIFSCLAALTNPDIDLSWAKFGSSLVDIKYLLQPVKARFSQSEEVLYTSHITTCFVASHQCTQKLLGAFFKYEIGVF